MGINADVRCNDPTYHQGQRRSTAGVPLNRMANVIPAFTNTQLLSVTTSIYQSTHTCVRANFTDHKRLSDSFISNPLLKADSDQ